MKKLLFTIALLVLTTVYGQGYFTSYPDSLYTSSDNIEWWSEQTHDTLYPSNLHPGSDSYIYTEVCANAPSDTLFIGDFSFSELIDPEDICRITVSIDTYSDGTPIKDHYIVLTYNGTVISPNLVENPSFWTTASSTQSYSIKTEDLFIPIDLDILNDETFGFLFATTPSYTFCMNAYLDKASLSLTTAFSYIDPHYVCEPFYWIDGNTYYEDNNTATYIKTSETSCDTIVTLDLNFYDSNHEIETDYFFLTVLTEDAEYQWLDCNNDYAIVPDEDAQEFQPSESGYYAVEVTRGSCIDTTACIPFYSFDINEPAHIAMQRVHPNPSNGEITVDLTGIPKAAIRIHSINGQLVYDKENIREEKHFISFDAQPGVYFLEITSDNYQQTIKLIQQ